MRKSEIYADRLDGLQVEVDDLKDKIFRSKARLSLLKETVFRGVLAGSRVKLAHRNLMGTGFKLEHAWHHRAAWDVSIAPKFVVTNIFHAGNHQWRLRKNNAVHLADGPTVRNQRINGCGVMKTSVGVDSIER